MPSRILIFVLSAAMIGFASPATAKDKIKPAAPATRTWRTVVDYVFANGTDRTLKAPLSRSLGYDSDVIATKAMRYKPADSADKKHRALYVISAEDATGKIVPKEFVLGNAVAVTKDGVKSVDDFFWRADMNGRILAAVKSRGPAGKVEETVLRPESAEAIASFKKESAIHLQSMDLSRLAK